MDYIDPIINEMHSSVIDILSDKISINKNDYNKLNYKKMIIINHADIFNIYKKQIEKYKKIMAALTIQRYYKMRLKSKYII